MQSHGHGSDPAFVRAGNMRLLVYRYPMYEQADTTPPIQSSYPAAIHSWLLALYLDCSWLALGRANSHARPTHSEFVIGLWRN